MKTGKGSMNDNFTAIKFCAETAVKYQVCV